VDELGGWFELGICEVDLFPVRRVDRDDSASFGYDVSDGAILTRYGAVLVAILHKQVEIGEGADVAAFRNVKPVKLEVVATVLWHRRHVESQVPLWLFLCVKDMRIPVRHRGGDFSTAWKIQATTSLDPVAQETAFRSESYLA
jgi:hypothetical protein